MSDKTTDKTTSGGGTQTLMRGFELIECVARGNTTVKGLTEELGLPRSNVVRILKSLSDAGYLYSIPYKGYFLGPRLVDLGERAAEQRPLVAIAAPILKNLSETCRDTVHLGLLDKNDVLYLEKISGSRGLEMRSRVGTRMPVASTGLGKSIMMSLPEGSWDAYYARAVEFAQSNSADRPPMRSLDEIRDDLRAAQARGWCYDMEENEYGIRCVGAPVFDPAGRAIAAISVASALNFMPPERMEQLGAEIRAAADALTEALAQGGY